MITVSPHGKYNRLVDYKSSIPRSLLIRNPRSTPLFKIKYDSNVRGTIVILWKLHNNKFVPKAIVRSVFVFVSVHPLQQTLTRTTHINKTHLIHFDDRLATLAHSHPLDGHLQLAFAKPNVILCFLRQLRKVPNGSRVLQPPVHLLVDHLDSGQIGDLRGERLHPFAVQRVAHAHHDLVERVQDVQLRHAHGRVAVDQRRVLEQLQILPPATPSPLRRHSDLVAAFLQRVSNHLWERGRIKDS